MNRRHADAVATHHHRVLLALLVGVVRVERLGVLRADLEDVPDLDAAVDAKRLAATRARVARSTIAISAHSVDVKSRPSTASLDVVVDLVRAGDPTERRAHRRVGDDDFAPG